MTPYSIRNYLILFGCDLVDFRLCLTFYDDFVIRFGGKDEVCHDHLAF